MSELGAASWKQRRTILRARPQPEEPKRSNHKDTKKWCKGVRGRKHIYVWTPDLRHCWNGVKDWYVNECTQCRKQNGYCWISTGGAWCVGSIDMECKCGFHEKGPDGKWKIK